MADSNAKKLAQLLDGNGDVLLDNLDNVSVTPTAVSDQPNTSTGGFTLPAGTEAQRPSSPDDGETRFNSDSGSIEFYDGTNWIATNLIPTVDSVSGTIYSGLGTDLTLSLSNATDSIDVVFKEGGTTLATVSSVSVSSGSASVTVPAAVYGQSVGDTIVISINNQDGTPSSNSQSKTVVGLPTGGTITSSGGYRYHTFTSSSSLVVPTGFSATADYLIVAGGGGGGEGGGGAGGMISGSASMSANTYSVVVGAGGAFNGYNGNAGSGGNSTFSLIGTTVLGGGGGGSSSDAADTGGSGGGGRRDGGNPAPNGASGTSGQGNAGGSTSPGPYRGGAGGGGKGAAGSAGGGGSQTSEFGGAGGVGATWVNGVYYAGGGGGGTEYGARSGRAAGGNGGGGFGCEGNAQPCTAGTANTGGGGGGIGSSSIGTGPGGSGIVIIRYQVS
jgi:hypothetical protein